VPSAPAVTVTGVPSMSRVIVLPGSAVPEITGVGEVAVPLEGVRITGTAGGVVSMRTSTGSELSLVVVPSVAVAVTA